MTTTSPDEPPSVAMNEEAYGALRASHALWAGTSVLITDRRGRVLLQSVTYRPTRLLTGGAVDKGESPAQGATREMEEELGVLAPVTCGLAVDWVSPTGRTTPPAMRFPGELLHVFDGGVWDEDQIAAIRPRPGEIDGIDFVEPAELPALMSPGDARRALSALRARINGGGPAFLEDGLPIAPTVLDRVGVLRTARARRHFLFHHARRVPDGLAVRQSWAWAFAPDGRVLVLLEPDTGAACLPGGTPEPEDRADPETTLIREAREEAAAELTGIRYLGYLSDPGDPCARVRYAAALTSLGSTTADPATGRTYVRILATPEQAVEFFDWGLPAAEQLQAVHQARVILGIPRAGRQPVTEVSAPIAW